jgi:proline iminopeptidase
MHLPRLAPVALVAVLGPAVALAAPERGQVFQAPGAALYVEVLGAAAGAPLVVVNGGPGLDHTYEHIAVPGTTSAWEVLARARRVVFYDQRGTGRSGPLAAGQSCVLADQIADLEAVRAHLGVDKIDLLGHSWGGYLVMAYAARHPAHIRHLVIVDAAAPKWTDTVTLFKDIFPEGQARFDGFAFADALGDPAATQAGLREYFSWLFYAPDKRDAFLAQASTTGYAKAVNEALDHDLARYDLNPELARFAFPTLVVTGRYDINVAPSVAYKIARAIPGAKLTVFERSGHLPSYEEPEAFVRAVDGFLGPAR